MMLSVEDFLTFQRRRLEADKQELVTHVRRFLECFDAQNVAAAASTSQDHTKKNQDKNSGGKSSDSPAACTPRHGSSMIKANQNLSGLLFRDDDPIGLPLGQHEEKRKKLAEERKADYNRFLIEKEKQLQHKKEAALQRRNTTSEASTPRSIASMNYQEVLQRKKEEEKQYRNLNHLDPLDDSELLRLQNEADKLKSERDNITMLINNLKRFADSEPSASTSHTQFSQSVPVVGASASPVKALNSFPVPPSFPSVMAPSTAPTAFPSMQGNGSSYQDMQNTLNFTQSLPLPTATQRMPNLEYQTPVQPLAFPSTSSSFQNPLFTGHMAAQQPKPNQFLSNADYMRELDEQVKQKQRQKMKEMEDEKRQQQNDFFPWGNTHGGGGAPMKDHFGNIITSRKGKTLPVMPSEMAHPLGMPLEKDVLSVPSAIANTVSTYNREYEAQRKHDRYKEDLRKQIEEKKRLLQEEKERQRLEEDRLAQRIEEQRLRMQREYEEEQAKRIRKEEELRLKQERLMQLQEEQRKEEERRKRETAEKRERERLEKLRELEEMRKNAIENQQRRKSPPVPTVRTQTLEREKTPKSEVPTDPRQNVLSQLTQLRQQLQDEQQKMNAKLKEQKKKYKVMDRRAVQEDSDDDDENEVQRLRRNSAKSRESSADSRGYTQRSRRWNKENIKYSGHDEDSDVRVENLD